MSAQELQPVQSVQSTTVQKPLVRLQLYLVEIKTNMELFREVLLTFKGVLFDLALIAFFLWEMYKLFKNLH